MWGFPSWYCMDRVGQLHVGVSFMILHGYSVQLHVGVSFMVLHGQSGTTICGGFPHDVAWADWDNYMWGFLVILNENQMIYCIGVGYQILWIGTSAITQESEGFSVQMMWGGYRPHSSIIIWLHFYAIICLSFCVVLWCNSQQIKIMNGAYRIAKRSTT